MMGIELLPENPSYVQACDLLDNNNEKFWLPVVERITSEANITIDCIERITTGANALFKVTEKLIIKIVPPNWRYQADADIQFAKLLNGQINIDIPQIVHYGEINEWVYIVMTIVPGITLSDVWADLSFANKKLLMLELGAFINRLHQIEYLENEALEKDWDKYIKELRDDCVPRHTRKGVEQCLVSQIDDFLSQIDIEIPDYFKDCENRFIHMDLHPWNLMVKPVNETFHLSGVIDFGDAIIGNSRLLELATPILFMGQGNRDLVKALIESYGLLNLRGELLQKSLMAVSLLRPACDFNFVFQQIPQLKIKDNWHDIAKVMFPI